MKTILTNSISTGVGLPIKSGTLDHLQASYKECLDAIIGSILNYNVFASSTAIPTILIGCKNTGSGLNYIISSGAIYLNNEIFLVNGTTFTAGSGQVAIGTITISYLSGTNADAVTFTDGVPRNVHQIKNIVFSAGASGTGDFDFTGLVKIIEDRRFIGAAGEPAFINGWANTGGNTSALSYKKNKTSNQVTINGSIAGNINTNLTNTYVFILPVGYRPANFMFFPVSLGVATPIIAYLYIDPNGKVYVYNGSSGTVNANIGDVTFYLD